MVNALPVHPPEQRPFFELVAAGEVLEVASRIATMVYDFFATIANTIVHTLSNIGTRITQFINPKGCFMSSVLKIPRDQRAEFITHFLTISVPDMSLFDQGLFVQRVIDSDDDTLTNNLWGLITPEMCSESNLKLIDTIASADAENKVAIIQFIDILSRGMEGHRKEELTELIARIPPADLGRFISKAAEFPLPHGFTEREAIDFIKSLTEVPIHELELAVELAPLFFDDDMTTSSRIRILQTIQEIGPAARGGVIRHAALHIMPHMTVDQRIETIHQNAVLLDVARGVFFANLRREPERNVVPGRLTPVREVYEAEQPVHMGRRDHRTAAAIRALLALQGDISHERLREAKDAFIAYINTALIPEGQKQRALDALLTPVWEHIDNDYGPLIRERPIYYHGDGEIPGEHFIGRLWIFASGLDDREAINVKDGMISAALQCYSDDGARICNGGKVQRFLIATLQGRMEGGSIDGELLNERVATGDAVNMFFLPPYRQAISSRAELERAARTFCDENLGVEREEFMQQISDFADLQGMQP